MGNTSLKDMRNYTYLKMRNFFGKSYFNPTMQRILRQESGNLSDIPDSLIIQEGLEGIVKGFLPTFALSGLANGVNLADPREVLYLCLLSVAVPTVTTLLSGVGEEVRYNRKTKKINEEFERQRMQDRLRQQQQRDNEEEDKQTMKMLSDLENGAYRLTDGEDGSYNPQKDSREKDDGMQYQ